jgi:hypothetical protein
MPSGSWLQERHHWKEEEMQQKGLNRSKPRYEILRTRKGCQWKGARLLDYWHLPIMAPPARPVTGVKYSVIVIEIDAINYFKSSIPSLRLIWLSNWFYYLLIITWTDRKKTPRKVLSGKEWVSQGTGYSRNVHPCWIQSVVVSATHIMSVFS